MLAKYLFKPSQMFSKMLPCQTETYDKPLTVT